MLLNTAAIFAYARRQGVLLGLDQDLERRVIFLIGKSLWSIENIPEGKTALRTVSVLHFVYCIGPQY